MKITESQLKAIILEEAAKVKKAIELKKKLSEIQNQLNEVMGGPHGGGKKTFKKADGGFSENPGALVEKEVAEAILPGGTTEDGVSFAMHTGNDVSPKVQEETFEFSEQELAEMLKMSDDSVMETTGSEGAESHEELAAQEPVVAENVDDPFTVAAPSKDQLSESVEVLRMRKLAGLI